MSRMLNNSAPLAFCRQSEIGLTVSPDRSPRPLLHRPQPILTQKLPDRLIRLPAPFVREPAVSAAGNREQLVPRAGLIQRFMQPDPVAVRHHWVRAPLNRDDRRQ